MSESKTDYEKSQQELFGYSPRQLWWIAVFFRTCMSLMLVVALFAFPVWLLGYFREVSLIFAVGATCVGVGAIGGFGYIRETFIPAEYRDSAKRIGFALSQLGTVVMLISIVLESYLF